MTQPTFIFAKRWWKKGERDESSSPKNTSVIPGAVILLLGCWARDRPYLSGAKVPLRQRCCAPSRGSRCPLDSSVTTTPPTAQRSRHGSVHSLYSSKWLPVTMPRTLLGPIGRKTHFPGYLDSYFDFRWSKGGSGDVSDSQPSESFHVSISSPVYWSLFHTPVTPSALIHGIRTENCPVISFLLKLLW